MDKETIKETAETQDGKPNPTKSDATDYQYEQSVIYDEAKGAEVYPEAELEQDTIVEEDIRVDDDSKIAGKQKDRSKQGHESSNRPVHAMILTSPLWGAMPKHLKIYAQKHRRVFRCVP
jgi:hypothetical protein